jgi:hypothetical protein
VVDAGIKQIKINKSEFPLLQFDTEYNALLNREEVKDLHYDFRYRIISEDKNRFSHWSEIIRYQMPNITTPFPYTASNRFSISVLGNTPKTINATWSFPSNLSIINKALTSNVATITTSSNHDLAAGDTVEILGIDLTFNGTYVVAATPTLTTFTYSKIASNVVSQAVTPNGTVKVLTDYINFFKDTTQYDVWIRWNDTNTTDLNHIGWTPWEYRTAVSSNSFSIVAKDENAKRVEIAIQYPTTVKTRDYYNNKLTLFRGISGTI